MCCQDKYYCVYLYIYLIVLRLSDFFLSICGLFTYCKGLLSFGFAGQIAHQRCASGCISIQQHIEPANAATNIQTGDKRWQL
jgi:hypothetical protein